jgi:uncharacterized protein YdhG (YjbR/CyaY superfamily)
MNSSSPRYNKSIKTVDQYIRMQVPAVAQRLRAIRAIVKKSAPKAVEGIGYSMPAYKLDGKVLMYFAAMKNHIGLYALPSTQVTFKKELEKYKTSKGTVQFQHDEPLPLPLIRKIVAFRVREALVKKDK